MGWLYRKSINLGPLRINLSKSGIGYSLGGKGVRTGVSAKGRPYKTISIPGTGLRYTSTGKGTGCLAVFLLTGALLAT